jgi:pimeloyl-ACP methyl ester carboxylesterase
VCVPVCLLGGGAQPDCAYHTHTRDDDDDDDIQPGTNMAPTPRKPQSSSAATAGLARRQAPARQNPRIKPNSKPVLEPVAPPAQPAWFSWALGETPESFMVDHAERKIHVLRWGASGAKRPLVFIHGGGASAMWYRFMAPFFSKEYDCVAISLSGCGDSDWAQSYSLQEWGQEILTVCHALGFVKSQQRPKPVMVAHSLGTYCAVSALRREGAHFEGAVLIDVAIRSTEEAALVMNRILQMRKTDPSAQLREGWHVNPPSVTPLERFKLRPFQQCENTYILKFIAESSAMSVGTDGSWVWKGDPNREAKFDWGAMASMTDDSMKELSQVLSGRLIFMYGEDSALCDANVAAFVREHLSKEVGVLSIPGASHHVWLDQPLGFVTALRGVFAAWGLANSLADEREEFLRSTAAMEARL